MRHNRLNRDDCERAKFCKKNLETAYCDDGAADDGMVGLAMKDAHETRLQACSEKETWKEARAGICMKKIDRRGFLARHNKMIKMSKNAKLKGRTQHFHEELVCSVRMWVARVLELNLEEVCALQ